jgi:hypothetical protein
MHQKSVTVTANLPVQSRESASSHRYRLALLAKLTHSEHSLKNAPDREGSIRHKGILCRAACRVNRACAA